MKFHKDKKKREMSTRNIVQYMAKGLQQDRFSLKLSKENYENDVQKNGIPRPGW